MKKLLLGLVILVSVMLLAGCGGVIPPPDEIPIDLIREYTGHDYVYRWSDGEVSVYDETNYEGMQDILDEINAAIDGPVMFKLSQNPDSQVKVKLAWYGLFVIISSIDYIRYSEVIIVINPETVVHSVYRQGFLIAAGIDSEKCDLGWTDEIETVLYWLYRLEPGYPLV
jgi:hypothetical protein